MQKDHCNHIPGDNEDLRTLPLTASNVEEIARQLDEGRNCRDIRITLLRRLERLDTASQRNVTYDDVYNAMVKVGIMADTYLTKFELYI